MDISLKKIQKKTTEHRKKMFNIISHQGNANPNYNETPDETH